MYSVLILFLFIYLFIYLFILISHYSPKMLLKKSFILEILGSLWKRQWYNFFHGAPSIEHF